MSESYTTNCTYSHTGITLIAVFLQILWLKDFDVFDTIKDLDVFDTIAVA